MKSLLLAAAVILAAPAAMAADRVVAITNTTSAPIIELYGSNSGTSDWEEDLLGEDVLGAGDTIRVNFDDGTGYCKFDFKAVYEDGTEAVLSDVNVCEVGVLTIE